MKGTVLFVMGVAVGFVVAHQAAKTPEGKKFFSGVDAKTREFTSAVVDGYREREAELRDAIAGNDDAFSEGSKRSK